MYKKNTGVVYAIQYTGDNFDEVKDFVADYCVNYILDNDGTIILSSDGELCVHKDDYIIQNADGKMFTCCPKFFKRWYTQVDAADDSLNTPYIKEEEMQLCRILQARYVSRDTDCSTVRLWKDEPTEDFCKEKDFDDDVERPVIRFGLGKTARAVLNCDEMFQWLEEGECVKIGW